MKNILVERTEILYETGHTRVSRRYSADGTGSVVCKEPLGLDALRRLRHETGLLRRLAGIEGVPQLVSPPAGGALIATEDVGGVSLAQSLDGNGMDSCAQVDFALRLTRIIADVHRAGIVHKDINPANILVAGPARRPSLIDFDHAMTFAEERPGFMHHGEIAGTLAYIAPEQTGRMGRSVDQRADLYSLGATLYELVTGRPPFEEDDPLQLIRDHLSLVPIAPVDAAPGVSSCLSSIIMRLLEKEPDRRYQSADGLALDLSRLHEAHIHGQVVDFPLGDRDFPLRLLPPSRLIGRQAEIDALRSVFHDASEGEARGVLVTGPPGVGKTALINALRSVVTDRGGWFVSGKYDQYRHDAASGAVLQAFSGLGRLLLAEPDTEIAAQRERIYGAVGPNVGLIAALLPEFASLLGAAPERVPVNPAEAEARLRVAMLDLLRAVVSPARPLVMVVDDLQWANAAAIHFVDAVLTDGGIRGLLLVVAYREAELDTAHPLYVTLRRWLDLKSPPLQMRLRNLKQSDIGILVEEMLRLRPAEAARFAKALGARAGGNPYDTVELVNALRQDGILTLGDDGWRWDEAAIRRHVGQGNVVDLLSLRISRLPSESRELLEIMACLGNEMEFGLLEAASGLNAADLEEHLAAPLEDGLLTMEHGGRISSANRGGRAWFRHDRVQQAAYNGLSVEARRGLHLAIARRLARLPDHVSEAAQQYLPAVDAIIDADERRRVAGLLYGAALPARRSANYATAERFLTAALAMLNMVRTVEDDPLLAAVETDLHAALYCLGRFEEGDAVYLSIDLHCQDPVELSEATCAQISSLTNRSRMQDAIALGLSLLRRLGLAVPPTTEIDEAIERGMDALYRWADKIAESDDLGRPEAADPCVRAAAGIMNRMMPAVFFADHAILAWFVIECRRLWAEYGPCAPMVGILSHIHHVTIELREDYHISYRTARHVLTVGEARGYEPETSQARFLYALGSAHWFEPLEESVRQGQMAHEGLLHGGDLQNSCFTYFATVPQFFDCAPTLDSYSAEVEAGLAFSARTGNHLGAMFIPFYRQLMRSLRGETDAPGAFTDASFNEEAHVAGLSANPYLIANYHVARALSAALFGNAADLKHHAGASMPLLKHLPALYPSLLARVLQSLALAESIRSAAQDERTALALRAELDICHDWLAQRVADAPSNFLYLLLLVEAERTWAAGDFKAAIVAFDSALYEAQLRHRPWHRALITERAARFHLAHGLEHVGRQLLAESRRLYHIWGASAKVRQLEHAHPFLNAVSDPQAGGSTARSSGVSSAAIDLLAVLRASQALSSETSLERLSGRVAELLCAMTGATAVSVVLWYDEAREWRLVRTTGQYADLVPVNEAAAQGLLPLSAFQYAQRDREPLLVEDATRDDRFARDPYISALEQCSMLVVPILSQGAPRAVLLLENRLSRGAFSADRLDVVTLIAGQLAVSLDNAMLYGSLERKVAERTEALEAANLRLEALSITDSLTGLANRRRFTEVLALEWLLALRTQSPIAMAMIDIDRFKRYNDHYGHLLGDACLKNVAAALRGSMSEDLDLVARYGGEEFAIVLPGADLDAARLVAQRACDAVSELREPHAASEDGVVTVSIGIAAVVPGGQSGSELLVGAADTALYEAKRAGRNRVISAPDA